MSRDQLEGFPFHTAQMNITRSKVTIGAGQIDLIDALSSSESYVSTSINVDIRYLGCKAHEDQPNFDNYTLLLNAITQGIPLLVPLGKTFLSDGALPVITGTRISGGGQSSSIKLADGANTHVFYSATAVTDVRMASFKIDGNKANQTAGTNARGIYLLGNSGRIFLDDLRIEDVLDHGVFFSATVTDWVNGPGFDSVVSRCIGKNCGSSAHTTAGGAGGTAFAGGCLSTRWLGCTGRGNRLNGFKGSGQYQNCQSIGNNSGFETGFNSSDVKTGTTYINCLAYGNGVGFRNQGEQDELTMVGCRAEANGGSGVDIVGSVRAITISDHISKNNGTGTGPFSSPVRVNNVSGMDGISIIDNLSTTSSVLLRGVRCFDDQDTKTQQYGVYVEQNYNHIDIDGSCDIDGNLTGAIFLNTAATSRSISMRGHIKGLSSSNRDFTAVTLTGSTSASDLIVKSVLPVDIPVGGTLVMKCSGTVTGTAGNKLVRSNVNGNLTLLINQASADVQDWAVDLRLTRSTTTRWDCVLTGYEEGGTTTQVYATFGIATGAAFTLGLQGTLGDAADSITQSFLVTFLDN